MQKAIHSFDLSVPILAYKAYTCYSELLPSAGGQVLSHIHRYIFEMLNTDFQSNVDGEFL